MNYTDLVTAAKAYADRNDIEVSDNFDTFIIMVESRINRVLKTREQSTIAYIPTIAGEEYYELPADYNGMRNVQINDDVPTVAHCTYPMSYLGPEQFDMQRDRSYSGNNYYTVITNRLQIYPMFDAGNTIEIVYYQKVPNLNATATTNWLSISHPDIYLAGLVAEIEAFAKNYEVSKGWYDRMTVMINELDTADAKERWGGNPLQIRSDSV